LQKQLKRDVHLIPSKETLEPLAGRNPSQQNGVCRRDPSLDSSQNQGWLAMVGAVRERATRRLVADIEKCIVVVSSFL